MKTNARSNCAFAILMCVCMIMCFCFGGLFACGAPAPEDTAVMSADTASESADSQAAVEDPTADYKLMYGQSGFDRLPGNWEPYAKSNVNDAATRYENGNMIIKNDGGSGGTYWGSVYRIATDIDVADFVFEMTFSASNWANENRFFSVMFHTEMLSSGGMKAYYVNYRISGRSAYCAINNGSSADLGEVNRGIRLDDGQSHTIKITCVGGDVASYMDGTLISEWNLSAHIGKINPVIEHGGFAVMVNQFDLSISAVSIKSNPTRARDHSISYFNGLPFDWEPLAKSNVKDDTTRYENGEMIITDTDGAAGNYYGAVYRIATGAVYGNFEFEIKFRLISAKDTSRFISVMFHTDMLENGNMNAYFVNYRVSGQSAPSAYSNGGAADGTPTNHGIRLDDGKYHTMRIECVGTQITDYMDGVRLAEWDLSDRADKIPAIIEEGGFAFMVNKATVAIAGISVSGLPAYDEIVNADHDMKGGLINGPSVVCDAVNAATLDAAVNAAVKPADIILHYNDDGNVVGKGGEVIGDFYSVFCGIRGKIIPVVKIDTQAAADRFISFITEKYMIRDLTVASSSGEVLKKLRRALPWARGVLCATEAADPAELVKELQLDLASAVIVPQSFATVDNVTYIHGRFKTVWVVADSYLSVDIYDCINSGAYGVVSEHFADVYDVLATYTEKSVARTSANVAHRGCSNLTYENSLSAVRLAIENGATHLELDGKLTKDGHIIIIHDDRVENTTTYVGDNRAWDMTLEQLQSYDLQLRTNPKSYLKDSSGNNIVEKLPSLEEVLELIKPTDVVLVFEIKTTDVAIVPVLKEVVESYGMLDRLIAITFDDNGNMINAMAEHMPSTPIAKLEGLGGSVWSVDTKAEMLEFLNTHNAALDKAQHTGGTNAELNRILRDRGMVGWYWTFGYEENVLQADNLGYYGVTNNCAEVYATRTKKIAGKIGQTSNALKAGDSIKVEVTDYSGAVSEKAGTVFWCGRSGSGWKVIASYKTDIGLMYTQSFIVDRAVA